MLRQICCPFVESIFDCLRKSDVVLVYLPPLFIKLPKWAIRIIHFDMANCLWNDNLGAHKFHLPNQETIGMLKEFGGFGIPNLRYLNAFLLAPQIKRYNIADSHRMWKQLVDHKYDSKSPTIFCNSIVAASQLFQRYDLGSFCNQNGFQVKNR